MAKEQGEVILWLEPGDLDPRARSNLSSVWPGVQIAEWSEISDWDLKVGISDWPGVDKWTLGLDCQARLCCVAQVMAVVGLAASSVFCVPRNDVSSAPPPLHSGAGPELWNLKESHVCLTLPISGLS